MLLNYQVHHRGTSTWVLLHPVNYNDDSCFPPSLKLQHIVVSIISHLLSPQQQPLHPLPASNEPAVYLSILYNRYTGTSYIQIHVQEKT